MGFIENYHCRPDTASRMLNQCWPLRATSNTITRSPSRFGFSEPPVSVCPWSPMQSESRRSCARRETPTHLNRLTSSIVMSVAYLSEPMSIEGSPLPVLDPPAPVLQTCIETCLVIDVLKLLSKQDCSPIALSVVTSVSGLNKEIQRLIECICQHNQVVADFRKALTMLAKIQDREQQCDRKNGLRCPCWNGIPSKRRLRPEDLQQDDLISQETNPSQHHDPTYVPTVGANFSMDHMPFRSKRSKKSPRNRRSARAKTQPKIPPNLCPSNSCQVDLTGERGGQSRRPRHPRSKSPRHSNCLQKHYNYLALVGSD
ncbi:hypothetical protein HN873_058653 [Arachis hypogaea]